MAELLSKEEIDSLLDIAKDGEDESGMKNDTTKNGQNYVMHDFRKPSRIASNKKDLLNSIHDKTIRATASEISGLLQKIVDIRIDNVEQITYGEFIDATPKITSFNILSLRPYEGKIILECNPNITYKIISELLGSDDNSFRDENRELTYLEINVIEYFYKIIIAQLKNAWREIDFINFNIESRETNSHATHIVSNDEVVLVVKFKITIGTEVGFLSICYPLVFIEELLDKGIRNIIENKRAKTSKKKDISALISGARMRVESMMAETDMTFAQILALESGDTIVFSKNANNPLTKVYINNKEKFTATSGITSNRKAIQIKTNVDHEKQGTLSELKLIREERDNSLDKKKSDITKIFANEDTTSEKGNT